MARSPSALIIESDPGALAQMRRVLEAMGISVTVAGDEETARQAAESFQARHTAPSLVVARVALPSGSGLRLIEELCNIFPGMPHLVVSHYPKNLLRSVPGFIQYADQFLQEEFTDEQFRMAVERTLGRRAMLRTG
jgi:DNA-binding response OmpR family regulator